jgi:Family of unknown function (DUF5670)
VIADIQSLESYLNFNLRTNFNSEMLYELSKEEMKMVWRIFLMLLALWFLGMITSVTLGGFIHIFLLVALAMLLIPNIQRRIPIV